MSASEDLLRELAPQVLGAVVRRYGHFDLAEDAVQEALLAAATQWPRDGVPDDPRAWLVTVAARRLTDLLRAEQARRRREDTVAARALPDDWLSPPADRPAPASDDTLVLLFMCCHPSLSPPSQLALTLRAVGGLTTAEIARAFMVSEATMTRRITRAKQRVKDSGVPFRLPGAAERAQRTGAVLHVLYLIFNEGYASTSGPDLHRAELAAEAIRLARVVHRLLPDDPEAAGLLALMLLTDARRPARTGRDGALVPMAEQDRTLWNAAFIAEGVELVTNALSRGAPGPYQLQAAIAALHDEAPTAEETDWPQITALYELLMRGTDNPMIALNHAVAVAMARGPGAGLDLLDGLAGDERLSGDHRLYAVRAHLLEMSGDDEGARTAYKEAAERAMSLPQQRYLHARAARLEPDVPDGDPDPA
ncbi:RNA polymerase sigma factor [Nonomuraea rubra]|uniref:RNA polymerase sigma factor (Sigma-70 family) n=1 Tax=Nonomuraea rubra TaxID=46180 RepID=A0A7X0NM57_9ACTN|nr:RNA polymerase sigma factor (sigma-70 family) [Nonomuraea rubra]